MGLSRRASLGCLCVILLAGMTGPGCASSAGRRGLTLGPIGNPSNGSATQPAAGYDDSAWRALLLTNVGPGWTAVQETSGDQKVPPYTALIDYMAIQEQPADLNAYLAVLARTGPISTPDAFPTEAHRLAYYINAFNACAIRAVLAEYPTRTMYAPMMPAFEYDWYFQVDGRRVNLDDLRRMALQQSRGDVRVLFALCSAAIGSPPLAHQPYRPADVYDNLDAQMRDCLARPQMVAISHDQQQLQLWGRIIHQREDFFRYYEKLYGAQPESLLNVVMELAPPRQRQALNKAVGYKTVEIPFDRRLNELVVRARPASASPAEPE